MAIIINYGYVYKKTFRERSGSVVDCLASDERPRVRASPASLRCVLEQKH